MPCSPSPSHPVGTKPCPPGRSLCLAVLLALTLADAAWSDAFVPTDDSQILERLPRGADRQEMKELRRLRAVLANQPEDLELAVHSAWKLIRLGRREGDPRYSGYAQAVLAPWWGLEAPPAEILLLRATLRQNIHEFETALKDLKLYLQQRPGSAQGWMTLALVQQVSGDLDGASASCLALTHLTDRLMSTACRSGVLSLRGRAQGSYEDLLRALEESPEALPDAQAWALTTLAEIAVLAGDAGSAEDHFRLAMDLGGRDIYLLAAYSDFLLDQDRPKEVLRLLDGEERVDTLLLRLAEAEQRTGSGRYSAHEAALEARFTAARTRGETTHEGSEARFRLRLQGHPREALKLALSNWRLQREPRDARLVLEAALAARQPAAAAPVLDWLASTGIEDLQLASLAARLQEITP